MLIYGFLYITLLVGVHGFGSNCQGFDSEDSIHSDWSGSDTKPLLKQQLNFLHSADEAWNPAVPLPEVKLRKNLRVVFLGDQGLGSNSVTVLEMVKSWKPDFVIHAGDFDYHNKPYKFDRQISSVLGENYPYFAAIGNHDLLRWSSYRKYLIRRLEKSGASSFCRGDYGVNMVCNYGGLLVVYSGIGVKGTNHVEFLDQTLASNPAPWKVCVWHKNQKYYQTGRKPDETGYGVYEVCRKHGAIVATGHEHSYSRTFLMSDFVNKTIVNHKSRLDLAPGRSFAFVSGLAGQSIRPWKDHSEDYPWWAATASRSNGVDYGAMICDFRNDQNAHCRFEDLSGNVWDSFAMTSLLANADKSSIVNSDLSSVPMFLDKQITQSEKIALITENGNIRCADSGLVLSSVRNSEQDSIVFQTDSATDYAVPILLQFNDLQQLKPNMTIDACHLQVLGLSAPQGIFNVTIRGIINADILSCRKASTNISAYKTTEASISWISGISDEEEGLEAGEVWVSPNLKELVDEILQHHKESLSFLTLLIEPRSRTIGASFEAHSSRNKCLAPSLTIQHVN